MESLRTKCLYEATDFVLIPIWSINSYATSIRGSPLGGWCAHTRKAVCEWSRMLSNAFILLKGAQPI